MRSIMSWTLAVGAIAVGAAHVVAMPPGPPNQCQTWVYKTNKPGSTWGKIVCKKLFCALGCGVGPARFQGFKTCRCGSFRSELDSCNGIFAIGVGGSLFRCPEDACPTLTGQTCEAPEPEDINEPAPTGGILTVTACVCAVPGQPRPLPFPAPPFPGGGGPGR